MTKMKYEDDDIIISLNWDLFHEHLAKCEECRNTCLDIWHHMRTTELGLKECSKESK